MGLIIINSTEKFYLIKSRSTISPEFNCTALNHYDSQIENLPPISRAEKSESNLRIWPHGWAA